MSLFRALGAATLVTVGLLGSSACASQHLASSLTPVRVNLAMAYATDGPTVLVKVGNEQPVRVLLDTGSVGLRILKADVPGNSGAGISTSGQPDRLNTEDGSVFRGFVARAVVRIGGVSTSSPIDFQEIAHIGCQTQLPHCPKLRDNHPKIVGILGIGMFGNKAGLPTNPLVSMPAPYDQSWSVHLDPRRHSGTLTIGAPLPRSHKTVLDLTSGYFQGPTRTWNDSPNMCWSIDTHKECGETSFDTGSNRVYVTGYPRTPQHGRGQPRGQQIRLSGTNGGKPIWSFASGPSCCSATGVVLQPRRTPTFTTGSSFFQTHVVTFDNRHGYIDIQ